MGLNPQSAVGVFHDTQSDSGTCTFIYDTPALLHRYVSFDGNTIALQQDFSYSTTWNSYNTAWTSKQTTATTTDKLRGTQFQTIYTYTPVSSGDPYQPGITTHPIDTQIAAEQTITYKDVNGAVLKTENKTWYDVRELQADQVTLDNGLTSQTAYTYGPGAQVTERDEYDYGAGTPGPLLRKTVYNYQAFANTAIFPTIASIFDRPCQAITYDGGGTRVAETDSYYDNGTALCGATGTPSVSAVSNLTGHDETKYGVSASGPRGNRTQASRWLSTGASVSTTLFL